MSDSKELRTLRAMAWERAKGELNAVKQTYWSDSLAEFDNVVEEFVKSVEDEGLVG